MDQIEISQLEVSTFIGVHQWEQKIQQKLYIDITLEQTPKPYHDDLNNTIDYDNLSQHVLEFVESKPFKLIETVAEEIADLIKNEFKAETISVKVSKPGALKRAKTVSFRVLR